MDVGNLHSRNIPVVPYVEFQKALSGHVVALSPQHSENTAFFSSFPLGGKGILLVVPLELQEKTSAVFSGTAFQKGSVMALDFQVENSLIYGIFLKALSGGPATESAFPCIWLEWHEMKHQPVAVAGP